MGNKSSNRRKPLAKNGNRNKKKFDKISDDDTAAKQQPQVPKSTKVEKKVHEEPKLQDQDANLQQLKAILYPNGVDDKPLAKSPNSEKPRNVQVDQRILTGQNVKPVDVEPKRNVVRFFFSSTFVDTKFERDCFLAFQVPSLRRRARELGLEFEASEMRWGINGSLSASHQTEPVCMMELERCKRDSVATTFVGILGSRYGYRPIPVNVARLPESANGGIAKVISDWYKWDDNTKRFILLPVTDRIPGYDPNVSDEKSDKWWDEFLQMQKIFDGALRRKSNHLIPSVTQKEMTLGIINAQDKDKTLLLIREFTGKCDDPRYLDIDYQVPLKALKDRIVSVLPNDRVKKVELPWFKGGIDPISHEAHQVYVVEVLKWMVLKVREDMIAYAPQVSDPVVEESSSHWLFGIERVETAKMQRPQVLGQISESARSQQLTIVRGGSGTGKSTLLAQLATSPPLIGNKSPVVVLRFVSVTANSTSTVNLMISICEQLQRVYPDTLSELEIPRDNPTELLSAFHNNFLSAANEENPLLLIIDATDQIVTSADVKQGSSWVPTNPPPHVHIVVSTLEPKQFGTEKGIEVPILNGKEQARELLDALLAGSTDKTLTTVQQDCILQKFATSSTPTILQFKLLFNEAISDWKSFTQVPPPHWEPVNDVRSTVNAMFDVLDIRHGKVFIDHALAAITWARDGLSEGELNDILSMNDDVLSAAFEWWVPPLARVPPLMVTRLLTDLRQYLTRSNSWFHRQFREACEVRYGGKLRETALNIFSGYFAMETKTHTDKPIVLTIQSGEKWKLSTDRFVVAPPEIRKLRELPRALLLLEQWDDFTILLTNFDFLLLVGKHGMVTDLQVQCNRAIEELGKLNPRASQLRELNVISRFLSLSRPAIGSDHRELAGQVLGRMPPNSVQDSMLLTKLCTKATTYSPGVPWWKPVNRFLQGVTSSVLERMIQCSTRVTDFAISPDSSMIVTACGNNLCLWDFRTGEPLLNGAELTGHLRAVKGVAFTPNGHHVVSCSSDQTIRKWDVRTGEPMFGGKPLTGHSDIVYRVVITPDGRYIVSGSEDATVRIWNCESGQVFKVIEPNRGPVLAVAASPDSLMIAAGMEDNEAGIWVIDTGESKFERNFTGYKDSILCLAFSPNGNLLVSGCRDENVYVWDARNGAMLFGGPLREPQDRVYAIAVSRDSKTITAASLDGSLNMWDANTGKHMFDGETIVTEHGDWISAIEYTSDGTSLVTASYDKSVRIWKADISKSDLDRSKEPSHKSNVTAVTLSNDGKTVATGYLDSTIQLWDADTGSPRLDGKVLKGHEIYVNHITFSSDNKLIVSASEDKTLRLWDVMTGASLLDGKALEGHKKRVRTCALSPDDSIVASGCYDKSIRLWDSKTGKPLLDGMELVNGHFGAIRSLAFSPNGFKLASGAWDASICIWEVNTGDLLFTLKGHSNIVGSLAFSKDGTTLRSVTLQREMIEWDVSMGKMLQGPPQPFEFGSGIQQVLVTKTTLGLPDTLHGKFLNSGVGFSADVDPRDNSWVTTKEGVTRVIFLSGEKLVSILELVE